MVGWLLTCVFAVAGSWFLFHGTRSGDAATRVSDGLHGLLCLAMIAMLWPWGARIPVSVQLTGYALAALWFLIRTRESAGHLHHALMAAGMAWMIVTHSRPHLHHTLPTAMIIGSVLLGVYFALAALPWFAGAVTRTNRPAIDAGAHATLSLGMTVLLAIPLAAG
jgi:hypothetical protein